MAGYIKTEEDFANSDFTHNEFGVEVIFSKKDTFSQENKLEGTKQNFPCRNTSKGINERRGPNEHEYQISEAEKRTIIPSVIRHTACPKIRLAYYRTGC